MVLLYNKTMWVHKQLFLIQSFKTIMGGSIFKVISMEWLLGYDRLPTEFHRAGRDGSWPLHLDCTADMNPYMRAFDRRNYFRWILIYLIDMYLLPIKASVVHSEFMAGHHVISRSIRWSLFLHLDWHGPGAVNQQLQQETWTRTNNRYHPDARSLRQVVLDSPHFGWNLWKPGGYEWNSISGED